MSGQSSSHSEHVQSSQETAAQTCELMLILSFQFVTVVTKIHVTSGQHTSLQTQVEGSIPDYNPTQSTSQLTFYGMYTCMYMYMYIVAMYVRACTNPLFVHLM